MKNEKASVPIVLIIGIIIALGVISYVIYGNMTKKSASLPVPTAYQAQYMQGVDGAPKIENASDLETASTNLDKTNTAEIDTSLKALDSASEGF